ncbi:CBS domain-containing protein [Teredinibacter sp. KSP-S5-2]|uniref:CBS domain-containing protein n=1 Tax=Teredinibacter sp. KSP-S5-2 TaxID=3034506 RepID=UPI0029350DFE|nr:CBS domain-containing protein [Teredinibacter sp. KSP-S5-2]WNO11010.1 CBS domain-containing protein [Teredinibacter sp. KSP-S5-2]
MQSILIKDFMDSNPHAIHQDTSISEAVKMLVTQQITGAPVIDDNKHLVGFVSEQDCIKEMLNDAFYHNESPSVKNVMSTNVKTVTPGTSLLHVAETMAKSPPKNYPVVEESKLVGVISRRLVLKALCEIS